MASLSFPPPPPTGPPPTGPPPTGPPPTGFPPPSPPPSPPNQADTTSASYFFGFVITFIVLLLLFVGCGVGSWRRFRLIGTAWDGRLQDMDGGALGGRKRGRRRAVRPVFWETSTRPSGLDLVPALAGDKGKWESVQPISAAFIWSRSKLLLHARKSSTSTQQTPERGQQNDGAVRGVGAILRSYVLPRRPRCDLPPKPPPPVERPPPEAIQVVVMIAMPRPPSVTSGPADGYVGHSAVGEYQIGVVRIPWPSSDGP